MASAYDQCMCGDYRHQHENGTGRCKLRELCTPHPCGRFRLHQEATEEDIRRNKELYARIGMPEPMTHPSPADRE